MKISKEVAAVIVLWATWLSSSVVYLMVKVAVIEDRFTPSRVSAVESTIYEGRKRDVWASVELFHIPDLVPAKKEK